MAVDGEGGRDFSIIGMLLHADPVVQGIAGILILSSVASWAIMLEKWLTLRRLGVDAATLEKNAAEGRLSPGDGPGLGNAIAEAARLELSEPQSPGETRMEIRSRLERAMRGALKGALRTLETRLPFLATVGSSAPFVGLLGTVWGIMHAFTGIAQSHDTSLAVVAPGIAEALFVTALGLFAAIPAVVGYNQISVAIGRLGERVGKAVGVLAKVLARADADNVRPMKGVR